MTPFVFNVSHYIQNHRCRLCGSRLKATRASSGGELPGHYGRRTMAPRDGERNRRQETTVMLSFILRWFADRPCDDERSRQADRKSTRLNSSHGYISYAVFCLKK